MLEFQRKIVMYSTLMYSVLMCSFMFGEDAQATPFSNDGQDFTSVQRLGDSELDVMRGGFITSNGMHIDFNLVTRTLVDNTVLQETIIDSRTLASIDPNSLRTIVQIGEQNISSLAAVEAFQNPGVISVIQNTLNDKVIQSLNILDVNVTNVGNFNLQALVPLIDAQAVAALR